MKVKVKMLKIFKRSIGDSATELCNKTFQKGSEELISATDKLEAVAKNAFCNGRRFIPKEKQHSKLYNFFFGPISKEKNEIVKKKIDEKKTEEKEKAKKIEKKTTKKKSAYYDTIADGLRKVQTIANLVSRIKWF
ncbi:hypothetical protein A3Q56_06963 [Intoshia linei]|uniref:Uncharacterized protein n=1 Tax=Intoshia linei TaxID=1819745 RepID=A0A177AUY3_9BILA|nr:hypothetical protein A3Q56_06963 [Intoshia linei]